MNQQSNQVLVNLTICQQRRPDGGIGPRVVDERVKIRFAADRPFTVTRALVLPHPPQVRRERCNSGSWRVIRGGEGIGRSERSCGVRRPPSAYARRCYRRDLKTESAPIEPPGE